MCGRLLANALAGKSSLVDCDNPPNSSSGKTSIAKLLQQRLPGAFMHVPLDAFIDMLPPHDLPIFKRMADGYHRSIKALSDAGNPVIVDHVLVREDWTHQCAELLSDRYVLFVGLTCPIEELERRELLRDVKRQGFARSQIEFIHKGKRYDLEIDTSLLTPEQAADEVERAWMEQRTGALMSLRQ